MSQTKGWANWNTDGAVNGVFEHGVKWGQSSNFFFLTQITQHMHSKSKKKNQTMQIDRYVTIAKTPLAIDDIKDTR